VVVAWVHAHVVWVHTYTGVGGCPMIEQSLLPSVPKVSLGSENVHAGQRREPRQGQMGRGDGPTTGRRAAPRCGSTCTWWERPRLGTSAQAMRLCGAPSVFIPRSREDSRAAPSLPIGAPCGERVLHP